MNAPEPVGEQVYVLNKIAAEPPAEPLVTQRAEPLVTQRVEPLVTQRMPSRPPPEEPKRPVVRSEPTAARRTKANPKAPEMSQVTTPGAHVAGTTMQRD